MNQRIRIIALFLIGFILTGCSIDPNVTAKPSTLPVQTSRTPLIHTPVRTITPRVNTPTHTPARAATKTEVVMPTMDFIETDYSHFFDAYPPMMHVSYTPHTLGYEYWTPIVNELARKLEIPDCKDWMMVEVINSRWEDIFEHYKVTIIDNGWTVLSSVNNRTNTIDGQAFNLGEILYDVGGDKERLFLVFDAKPPKGNPYYVLFFYDER